MTLLELLGQKKSIMCFLLHLKNANAKNKKVSNLQVSLRKTKKTLLFKSALVIFVENILTASGTSIDSSHIGTYDILDFLEF